MPMPPAAIATLLILAALSLWANARFKHHARLPMQWGGSGKVNWTAPRALALCLTPALAAGTFLAITLLPHDSQNPVMLPTILFTAGIFLFVHLLHIGLIAKHFRQNRR